MDDCKSFDIKLIDGRYFRNVVICDEDGVLEDKAYILDCGYRNDEGEYLVHESKSAVEQNKHHYEDEEVHSNHEWRTELTEYIARKLKYGHGLEDKDYLI